MPRTPASPRVQSISFSCSFQERNWPGNRLAPYLGSWRPPPPPPGKSWIRHCKCTFFMSQEGIGYCWDLHNHVQSVFIYALEYISTTHKLINVCTLMDGSPKAGTRIIVKIRSNSMAMLSGSCQGNVWKYLMG